MVLLAAAADANRHARFLRFIGHKLPFPNMIRRLFLGLCREIDINGSIMVLIFVVATKNGLIFSVAERL